MPQQCDLIYTSHDTSPFKKRQNCRGSFPLTDSRQFSAQTVFRTAPVFSRSRMHRHPPISILEREIFGILS
ncbi:hypothetical protein AFE_1259 [Acidithiobacillus ferrooxidans ATCC 23270]|uniref:Uncharacterized protein n=1 Tax=Acidithiobacillus ferrooxidans (strain ATCC 23270 / DSM 14882 / CIP 104768 / NCIMB 8455) TaxID=243159 RepID=B7J8U1_ACIF2|nr:hypothetical protein AFE_1259 [Acidithiobacillus ferrooxidans ATCC 23270]